MNNPPARFCCHARTNGDASRCSCTNLPAGRPHTKAEIIAYEKRKP